MPEICTICQHAKIQAINDAIDSGRYMGVIARQYRLDLLELDKHREHRRPTHGQRGVYTFDGHVAQEPSEAAETQVLRHKKAQHLVDEWARDESGYDEAVWPRIHQRLNTDDATQVTENPLRQFTHAIDTAVDAYQLAHDDPRMQAHMRERLQEKIKLMVQSDE